MKSLEAPNIATLKDALSSSKHLVCGFVIDLHVPQMSGVSNFRDLGLGQLPVDVYWCGAQLVEILSAPDYSEHRGVWADGLLSKFSALPFLILSTNQNGHEVFDRYAIPVSTPTLWKDAPGSKLEEGVRNWLEKLKSGCRKAVVIPVSRGVP